jgi:hypothetical protein
MRWDFWPGVIQTMIIGCGVVGGAGALSAAGAWSSWMFNYDWFHGPGLQRQIDEAKNRCAAKHFPGTRPNNGENSKKFEKFRNELETRVILYMKDGLTYEMKEMADLGMSSALAFECTPVDESYQVGAYVIVVPFEDIARVEVFAVHPSEKPQENIRIPGFRANAAETARE